jgi:hypothetical protein
MVQEQADVAAAPTPLTLAAARFERPCTVRAGKGHEHAGAASILMTPLRQQVSAAGRWSGDDRRRRKHLHGSRTKNHVIVLPGTWRDMGHHPAIGLQVSVLVVRGRIRWRRSVLSSHAGEAEDAGEVRGEPLDDGVAAAGGGGVHCCVYDDADFRDDLRRQKVVGRYSFELLSAVAGGHCSRRTGIERGVVWGRGRRRCDEWRWWWPSCTVHEKWERNARARIFPHALPLLPAFSSSVETRFNYGNATYMCSE